MIKQYVSEVSLDMLGIITAGFKEVASKSIT